MGWAGDHEAKIEFLVKGIAPHGTVRIQSRTLHLELDVPFIFRIFEGRGIDRIEKEVGVWLDKARHGELLAVPC